MTKSVYQTFFIIILTIIISYFFIGLLNFKAQILSIDKYTQKLNSNIVILTGGSNRIKDGLKIINNFEESSKINFKILISGTGEGFTKKSLRKILTSNFDLKLFECCIELESISKNTYSNARETNNWVKKNKIKKIILITSNYHMPRALLEFKNKMPNLKIFTHTITPRSHDIKNWLRSLETFSLVFTEYLKLIVAILRINILNI